MATWEELEASSPELGAHGRRLLLLGKLEPGDPEGGLAYLATVKRSGAPRVHPISPAEHGGRLYAFVLRSSPKHDDLVHDGRFALHSWPQPFRPDGFDDEEWYAEGRARLVTDEQVREAVAAKVGDDPNTGDVFELDVGHVLHKSRPGGRVVYRHWPDVAADGAEATRR